MSTIDRMREEWELRAREDPYFYVAFSRRSQAEEEFAATAAEVVAILEKELPRLPPAPAPSRRALEIGCGPGRLMQPMSRHFGEIHGVDISEEMAALARERLRDVPGARVTVTSGADLSVFPDGCFDFVYSYTVFQHIPDPAIVLHYLAEARRVLRAGGVLCCQLRGAPPLPTETALHSASWTGSFFTGERMAAFACERDFHLVEITGLDTQYMWTTWVKPTPVRAGDQFGGRRAALQEITASHRHENRVPARGRYAAASLWIAGLPHRSHLGNLEAEFGGVRARGYYLSPVSIYGECQMNVRVPCGVPPGPAEVTLYRDGIAIAGPRSIEVLPSPPHDPRVISVSDGVNIASRNRVEMGGMKVTIEDLERPEDVSLTVGGVPPKYLLFELKDPVTSRYEFAFLLRPETPLGARSLVVRVSGRELPAIPVEIAGLAPQPESSQRADQKRDAAAQPQSDAPLGPAVEPKRNLAGALARWFHHKKA